MKHIISIGIDNANGLNPLRAAVSGAQDFARWGITQGYTTSLYTDENNNVTIAAIFNEINRIVRDGNCEQLIIFFSGHGILKSPGQEVWLLSDAFHNPNESVNLAGSIDNAWISGVPYVVFISDACRVLPTELQLTGNGSVIFPINDVTENVSVIDILYAARPGNIALEQSSKVTGKNSGLFTEAILEILQGHYPEIVLSKNNHENLSTYYNVDKLLLNPIYKNLDNDLWGINLINSESPLKSLVKSKVRKVNRFLNHSPELRIQYQNPKPFLAEFSDDDAKTILVESKSKIKEKISTDKALIKGVQKKINSGLSSSETENKSFKSILANIDEISVDVYNVKSNLIKNSEFIFDSRGKSSFETETGFTIIGTNIIDVFLNGYFDIFREGHKTHIRVFTNYNPLTAIIILKNGHSVPVAILKGYVGTLIFEKNRLLTVNYTPSRNTRKYEIFKQNEDGINFVRSFVASAANEGFNYSQTFKNEFTSDGYLNFSNAGSYLRQEKAIDPSLGLYAVYAYRQEGNKKDVKSVYRAMRAEADNMLFDVAMLAQKLSRENQRLAPFCPMIALGWAYRQSFEQYLDPIIIEASNFMVPGLWTTFDKRGTEIVINMFKEFG